ncbi:MAG: helix-turn-helix transcriptional regulator [Lachnospiraceae bacterium]|nr:helix-turn-helix transcriptional regulator [uncultured Acetatifactor sp.]MCI9218920.1 helix-turn-helix transcriptional regulator [Lachnospiraceae bacterium]
MFDTMKVARKIREARISRNMTQMNLADAMEVSYQAVSNWERGNSMPDISKLELLCRILDISLEELLGTDSASRTLNRIIEKEESPMADAEPITIEQIREVAPILPPADVERLVDDRLDSQTDTDTEEFDLNAITGLAPFLDAEYLDALVKRVHVRSLKELSELAPFLGSNTLDALTENAELCEDMSGVISLAPFLSAKTLDRLVRRMLPLNDWHGVLGLAPFLSSDTLDALVEGLEKTEDMAAITGLAPFLSAKTLDRLVRRMLPLNDWHGILGLAPFLGSDTLDALVENADPEKDMSHITSLAPFLCEETLGKFLGKLPDDAHADISGLYPFLSRKTLQEMAERLMRGRRYS